jgi:hypothetical protein
LTRRTPILTFSLRGGRDWVDGSSFVCGICLRPYVAQTANESEFDLK